MNRHPSVGKAIFPPINHHQPSITRKANELHCMPDSAYCGTKLTSHTEYYILSLSQIFNAYPEDDHITLLKTLR